ncbi:MAG: hypothetical protein HKM93_16855 [Desulfobacteraceae bacterium]|nr:hypothetical protein [Desulfobacteraceae bacterium]
MKVLQRFLVIMGITLLFLPSVLTADVVRQERLEAVRDNIVFPEMSLEEKRVLAEQAQIFIKDLYVHRYVKMDYYGNDDPVPAIDRVVANLESMTTAELEKALWEIFIVQRDLHLNYYFPSPHADYTSFLPLTFVRAVGEDNFFQVRIQAVNADLMRQFAPGQRIPAVGDKVIAYDGVPIVEAVRSLFPIARGANDFGGFIRALDLMTQITHVRHLVPENNEVTILLRSAREDDDDDYDDDDGDTYHITLPWIAEWSEPEPGARRFQMEEKKRFDVKEPNVGMDDYQQQYTDFLRSHGLEPPSIYPDNPSNVRVVKWGIIKNRYGRFGYINLTSFYFNVNRTVNEIRRLLLEELSDTDGLIFDVRNNGGGYINLADRLPQLFMPEEAQVLKSRFLNTDLNRKIMNESILSIWELPEFRQVINDVAGTSRIYSDGAAFTYDSEANFLGQIYYKPVAVLANARSYSATDMFTCSIQDNNAAVIYGEDPQTGAGGANVIEHGYFLEYGTPDFVPLPFNHDMRVSWRQNIRFGAHEGELIEDYGCFADKDVSMTLRDVITGGEDQVRKISKGLARMSRHYKGYARGEEMDHEVTLSLSDLQYGIFVAHTDYVNVSIDGELALQIPVFARSREEFIDVNFTSLLSAGDVANVKFEGFGRGNRLLWNLKREIVVLGELVVLDETGLSIDFSSVTDVAPLAVINRNPVEDGWNLVTPYLQVGYTPDYANFVDSDAVLYLDMTGLTDATLSFGLEFDTEPDWDFVRVFVTQGETRRNLLAGSGPQDFRAYSFDLSEFAGQNEVVLHFRFTSDSNTTFPGAKFHYINIH